MKWMKERDLLIAQTMAFVQSVSGKKPDADMMMAAPLAEKLVYMPAAGTNSSASHPARSGGNRHRCRSAEGCSAAPVRETRHPRRFRIRGTGAGCDLPCPPGTVPAGARGVLQYHHGEGSRHVARRSRAAAPGQVISRTSACGCYLPVTWTGSSGRDCCSSSVKQARCSIGYSHAHSSATLAAQATSRATVSVRCTRSQAFWEIVLMAETSGNSRRGVSGILFRGIQDSLGTQGLPKTGPACSYGNLEPSHALSAFSGSHPCPTRCSVTTPS